MQIKHTDIHRKNWQRVIERTQVFSPIENGRGVASLMRFDKLTAPFVKDYGNGEIIPIIFEGGYWLQAGIDGEPYFYTAMFDERGTFKQVYVDITAGNICSPPDTAHFDDLFLDIVYTAGGNIYVLDRDELDEALKENVIDKATFDRVLSLADEKIANLKNNGDNVILRFIQLYKSLRELF